MRRALWLLLTVVTLQLGYPVTADDLPPDNVFPAGTVFHEPREEREPLDRRYDHESKITTPQDDNVIVVDTTRVYRHTRPVQHRVATRRQRKTPRHQVAIVRTTSSLPVTFVNEAKERIVDLETRVGKLETANTSLQSQINTLSEEQKSHTHSTEQEPEPTAEAPPETVKPQAKSWLDSIGDFFGSALGAFWWFITQWWVWLIGIIAGIAYGISRWRANN